jgi:tyrosyl-tRNA synthetase
VAERPQARQAQRTLATDITTLVHGEAATRAAIDAGSALFGRGDLGEVDEPTLAAALAEAGLHRVEPSSTIVSLLVSTKLANSLSEARRTVAEGGANINNHRITDPEWVAGAGDLLHGRYLVVRRGRRAVAGAEVGSDGASVAGVTGGGPDTPQAGAPSTTG